MKNKKRSKKNEPIKKALASMIPITKLKKNLIFQIQKKSHFQKCKEWTFLEDQILLETCKNKEKAMWKKCAFLIKNKSPKDCKNRFYKINKTYKKGRWTKEEDNRLISLIKQFGNNWILFSKIIRNRTTKQIRVRYKEYIDNKLNKEPFSKSEDENLLFLYFSTNKNWKIMKLNFPNRSFCRLKRRIKILLRQNSQNNQQKSCQTITKENPKKRFSGNENNIINSSTSSSSTEKTKLISSFDTTNRNPKRSPDPNKDNNNAKPDQPLNTVNEAQNQFEFLSKNFMDNSDSITSCLNIFNRDFIFFPNSAFEN